MFNWHRQSEEFTFVERKKKLLRFRGDSGRIMLSNVYSYKIFCVYVCRLNLLSTP